MYSLESKISRPNVEATQYRRGHLKMRTLLIALFTALGINSQAAGQALERASTSQPSDGPKKTTSTGMVNGYAEQLKVSRKSSGVTSIQNQAYAPIKKPSDEGQIPEIEMFIGESRVFPAPGVGRIAVGNGAILTAAALDGKEIILFANGVGTSSLFIWNEDGRYQRVKINIVPGDTGRYAREIAAFLTTIPKAKASIIGDKVIVEGDGLSDADLARIDLLATHYPQIVNFTNRLGFEQMVMIDVKVVEFPTTELHELGLKWNATGGTAIGGIWGPFNRGNAGPYQINLQTGQSNPAPIANLDGSSNGVPIPSGLNIRSVLNLGLNATLNALAQEGKTTILAEPLLSARNGSKASFLAGGEFPYTVSTINGTTVQFKPYGVKLDILPRLDRNGHVRATIETEVSNIDNSVSTNAGPALLTRKTSTEFNVRSGETIVLSGLIQRENSTSIDKVPGLGAIPIIGALFRSKKFQNKETELVVFVTPTIVDAQSPGIVDRIERTQERLQERLGDAPYLSDPLQPNTDLARPDRSSPAPGVTGDTNSQAAPLGTPSLSQDSTPGSIRQVGPAPRRPAVTTLTPVSFDNPLGSTLRVKADGVLVRAEPNIKSDIVLHLGTGAIVTLRGESAQSQGLTHWLPVQVGEVSGWVAGQWVEPVRLHSDTQYNRQIAVDENANSQKSLRTNMPTGSVKDLTLGNLVVDGQYAILASRLALRITPDINAPLVSQLDRGLVVSGLRLSPRGAWTAVEANGLRGWVATQWLQPVEAR